MNSYDAYVRSDEGGKQFILRQMFVRVSHLEDRVKTIQIENDQLRQEIRDLKVGKNRFKEPLRFNIK